jgi:DNA modification methylase
MALLSDGQDYYVYHGDCIPHLREMPRRSVDLAVFSPPFPSTFAYTSFEEDLGNSEDLQGDAKLHFGFFFAAMLPVMKPGRVMVVHLQQIHYQKRSGREGLFDFHGLIVRLARRAGFVFDYTWSVWRNPQAQALRTKKWELKFQGLESDRAQSRGAMPDYLLKFRAPGKNKTPISSKGEVSRNDWIDWAQPCWHGIKETDTLNVTEARGEKDTRHVCPLQKGTIDRLVRMYSNPGEVVFSPFAGIASELFVALKLNRRAYGVELKEEYHTTCIRNCERAIRQRNKESKSLFDGIKAR